MKNKYKSLVSHTFIFCKHRGNFEGVWIDTLLLDKIKKFSGTWCITEQGNTKYAYTHAIIEGKPTKVYMHRILIDAPINSLVDHKNGNGLDDRLVNLSIVSNAENQQNRCIQGNNTSGVIGISWNKRANKWEVRLQINKKNMYLGLYADIGEAKRVREDAEAKHFPYLASIDDTCFS